MRGKRYACHETIIAENPHNCKSNSAHTHYNSAVPSCLLPLRGWTGPLQSLPPCGITGQLFGDRHRTARLPNGSTTQARAALVTLVVLQPTRLAAVARAKLPPRHTVSDSILASGDRKEGLSRAYVQAVASAAGYTLAEPNLDRDGVDVQIRAGGQMRPSLDMQLKATVRLRQHGAHWRFPLLRRNYDLLREPTMVPRVLVVLDLPEDEQRWLSASAQELVMRRCAYWVAIPGAPESENEHTLTISIPTANRLDVPALKDLMDRARSGTLS